MDKRKKIIFIVNPHSGTAKSKPGHDYFEKIMDPQKWIVETKLTTGPGEATELASTAIKNGSDVVVAVGGDGTVNEVARVLPGTSAALGIVPFGSGNGLARHHKIPVHAEKACVIINQGKIVPHDAVTINKFISFNVSGIGFDAHVAELFAAYGKRGFKSYIELVLKEIGSYAGHRFAIDNGGKMIHAEAMQVSIANGSQFGNGAAISPEANTNDGLVNIVAVKRIKLWNLPWFMISVFSGNATKSSYVIPLKTSSLSITTPDLAPLHIDGEPMGHFSEFKISVLPQAIRMIVP